MEIHINGTTVKLIRGNITEQDTDAIVNAANSSLMGGGGVDGAIHRAGGQEIREDCIKIRKDKWPEGLPPGESVITRGGKLRAKFVIHTVGPVWRGGNSNESETLRSCYVKSLNLADRHRIKSVSFPSISTGAYGYPVELAAEVALQAIKDYILLKSGNVTEIRLVLFSSSDLRLYSGAAEKIFSE